MCKCLNCGIELEKWQKVFCSISCENSFRAKEKRDEYALKPNHCEYCGEELSFEKRNNRFCSRSCSAKVTNEERDKTISEEQKKKTSETLKSYYRDLAQKGETPKGLIFKERTCMVCGTKYYKTLTPGSTKKMCSKKCSDYYKKHRKDFLSEETIDRLSLAGRKSVDIQGERQRSKNEIYFCELCEQHFKNVKHNARIFNGWDADVVIEDIKYAVMWNGVWHYQKVYKDYRLDLVEIRDKKKIIEIENCGYIPYIIKDLGGEDKKFVENEFEKFLKYIAD